jgi:DNA-binding transcriptional LysR family regulator
MLKVTLEQWRMFQAVVEYGGFNQASQAIHKSQSSIHSAVSKIEHSLGVKLFHIEGRKTLLTDSGKMMLRRAQFLLDEASKVESVGLALSKGVESNLRIAVEEIFPQHLLYQTLDKISQNYPYLHVELMETVLNGSNELVDEGKVDIAISPFPFQGGFTEELCDIEFIPVASPDHPLHQLGRELTFEDLKSYRQIVVRDSGVKNNYDAGWLEANQRWTVTHIRTSIDMIVNGFGFAWLCVSTIIDELNNNKLKVLPIANAPQRRATLHLVFKDGDKLGPATRDFIGELRYQTMNLPTLDCVNCKPEE